MPMSQEEMLARISASIKDGSKPSDLDPAVLDAIQKQRAVNGNGLNAPLHKVTDPEELANKQIEAAINGLGIKPDQMNQPQAVQPRSGAPQGIQDMMKVRAGNGINPETGMPFYSPQAAPSPEDDEAKQQLQFKMQYLKDKANGQ